MVSDGVAHLDDIEEADDGRCPYRGVRHHFGITTFRATTWTAKNAGDRVLNQHDAGRVRRALSRALGDSRI